MQRVLLVGVSIASAAVCAFLWFQGYTTLHWTVQFAAEMFAGCAVFALVAAVVRPSA